MKSSEKVAVGFVDHGTVRGEFAHDLFLLGASRPGRFAGICNAQDNLISRGRNTVVKYFLESQADWLFFLDADQCFNPETFDALVEVADAEERPVVTGLYFAIAKVPGLLYPLPTPTVFTRKPGEVNRYDSIIHYPPNATIQVDACGAGIMLVHRSVFEKISAIAEPGFENCWFQDRPLPDGEWIGEDIDFCQKITSVGIKIFCHTGAVSPHIKNYLVEEDHFEQNRSYLESLGHTL